jgi:UDP-N-acetyl-D-mannosaminuronic acid transferase (WecB/TagA/CpsF family)
MITKKVFTGTKSDAKDKILQIYKNQGYCITNFIYFAMLQKHILEKPNKEYIEAMEKADLILPDGIALKLFLKKNNINISENLN